MQMIYDETKIKRLPAARVTCTERESIEAEANRLGISVSEYTRQALKIYVTLTRGGLRHAEVIPQT